MTKAQLKIVEEAVNKYQLLPEFRYDKPKDSLYWIDFLYTCSYTPERDKAIEVLYKDIWQNLQKLED